MVVTVFLTRCYTLGPRLPSSNNAPTPPNQSWSDPSSRLTLSSPKDWQWGEVYSRPWKRLPLWLKDEFLWNSWLPWWLPPGASSSPFAARTCQPSGTCTPLCHAQRSSQCYQWDDYAIGWFCQAGEIFPHDNWSHQRWGCWQLLVPELQALLPHVHQKVSSPPQKMTHPWMRCLVDDALPISKHLPPWQRLCPCLTKKKKGRI